MFLVTSIAMLRERTTGTLERLMTMPLAKLDLLVGYGIAFGAMAIVQAVIASAVGFGALGLDVAGPAWLVVAAGRRSTRCSGWRWGCSVARSRAPSSRPCSSCPRSFARSSCCAG